MEYFIGDIHGMILTLESLLSKIQKQDENAHFVFVGDYGDRGTGSKQVIDLCISLQKEGHNFIRGNHDDVIDSLMNIRSCQQIRMKASSIFR